MESEVDGRELIIRASIGKHLAFAPVAFAVTEGPGHDLLYANTVFRQLQSVGDIRIGADEALTPLGSDLTPLLDQVFRNAETVRDATIRPPEGEGPVWSCTVWPVPGSQDVPQKLVIEVRDAQLIEGAKARQRAIAERLLLGALREQDVARDAVEASGRARFLAKANRDLSMSLDESTTRDTVRRLTLPRPGTWCIVDVVESNGAIHRLAVIHPDPAKQALARQLEQQWPARRGDTLTAADVLTTTRPEVVTNESGAPLMLAAHGEANLRILRQIGFGSLLVVPLIVRARVQGMITFVSPSNDPPFAGEEIALAVEIAAGCALALDNARLYREADALRLAAELANQSKTQFLGSMSHELRTPLNAIGGFADLIELGIEGPVTDKQHRAITRIKANQQHLLKLITDILNFVRVESGRMEYRNTEVGVAQAFTDVIGMLGGAITERGLTLESPVVAADVTVWADGDRVRQILVNLLMNAVKYTPQNGGTIRLEAVVSQEAVIIHVADTGPGISSEQLESIFEPFVQLAAGLTDRRGGVGLGLAISRDLARGMSGDLTVESTVGVGSRFTLTLPRARAKPREPGTSQGTAARRSPQATNGASPPAAPGIDDPSPSV